MDTQDDNGTMLLRVLGNLFLIKERELKTAFKASAAGGAGAVVKADAAFVLFEREVMFAALGIAPVIINAAFALFPAFIFFAHLIKNLPISNA